MNDEQRSPGESIDEPGASSSSWRGRRAARGAPDTAGRARPYRPAAVVARRAIASAAAWAALGALWAGALAHAASRLFAPVELLLPPAIGAVVGGSLALVIRRLRLSRPRPAIAIASAAAVLALALQLVLDFRTLRAEREARFDRGRAVREAAGVATRQELAEYRAAWMEGWTLWRYTRARIGFDDTGAFTGTPPVLGRRGALVMSAFELLLAIAIAAAWAGRAAGEPACAACGAWRERRALGSAAHGVAREVVARLRGGDAAGAAALVRPPDTHEAVMFWLLSCPAGHDGDGGVLRVSEVFWTRRRRLALQRIADLEVDGAAVEPLAAELRAAEEAEE